MLPLNSQVKHKMKPQENLVFSKESLIQAIQEGFKPKYLFFWGHQAKNNQVIAKECLSQWYPSSFSIQDITYATAEHYMMAQKARLFQDEMVFQKILTVKHPAEAKKLGREIQGFEQDLWEQHRFDIVVKGNLAKFQQNLPLKDFLLNTGDKIIVEASPVDKIWGIGLAQSQTQVLQPEHWLGLNLLGFALMKVRALLCAENNQ